MHGMWVRLSPDQLDQAKRDGVWWQLETDDNSSGTDKAWQALDFLLDRAGFPVDIIFGEVDLLPQAEEDDDELEDPPPRYLTPERVLVAAEALDQLGADDLLRGVDPAELERKYIYPGDWREPGQL